MNQSDTNFGTSGKPISFVAACKSFFGYQPGQGLKQFGDELKALSDTDKNEIRDGLMLNGYHISEIRESAEPVAQAA